MHAIISVAEREGLVDLARELQSHDVAIYATADTRKALAAKNIGARSLDELSGFPMILDGSVAALHPLIMGGIMARRGQPHQMAEMKTHHITPIDLVVVNFSPFARNAAFDEKLERVDIGGTALVRAAARNFRAVIVLVRPQDYALVMQEWREQGEVSLETRRQLAEIAFQYTASYDSAVAEHLRATTGQLFPDELTLPLQLVQKLCYGENPHQQAALYRWEDVAPVATSVLAGAQVLAGSMLSFNNLLDLDVALGTVQCFTAPTVTIVKHANLCGLACDDALLEAYRKAHASDPVTASGGVIGCNRPVDESTAHEICQLFYKAVIAPDFTPEALALLLRKKNMHLLVTRCPIEPLSAMQLTGKFEVRSVSGGLLLQTPDAQGERETEYEVVTEREPNLSELTDLLFAWKAVRHVKSNAIVLAHKLMLLGVGAGQMNRATSVQLALDKAGDRARGSVMASDASFPFADGIEMAARAGITAIIQPGGSVRDEEAIRQANRYAVVMLFTGRRHFRH